MQTPKRPPSAREEDVYTPHNPFQSKVDRVSAENVDSLSREQVVRHVHGTLHLLHGHARPAVHPQSKGAWFPIAPSNHVAPTENLDSLTLCRMIDCVHKDPSKRNEHGQVGLVGVGAFVMDAEDFGRTMIKQTPKAGDEWHVHDAMADALGAGSFSSLKVAELFIQGREWLTERVENRATSQSDRTVWKKMVGVLGRVEDAVTTAIQHGAIDGQTANQVVMRTEMTTRQLSAPYKDWAPPVTALLDSITQVVTAKDGSPRTPELRMLANTMASANEAYDNAKTGRDNLVAMPSLRDNLARPEVAAQQVYARSS